VKNKTKKRQSLLFRIIAIFIIFSVVLNVAHIININHSCGDILGDYFENQVISMHHTLETRTNTDCEWLDSYITDMTTSFPELNEALTEGNYEPLEKELVIGQRVVQMHGYVVTDLNGDIQLCSYKNYSAAEEKSLQQFAKYVIFSKSQKYSGFARVLNLGPCIVSAHVVKNSEGDDAALIIGVEESFWDNENLKSQGNFVNMTISVYDKDICVASGAYDVTEVKVIGMKMPNEWVVDSCYINKHMISTIDSNAGISYQSVFNPIIDYRGEVIGIIHGGLDINVITDVQHSISANVVMVAVVISLLLLLLVMSYLRHRMTKPLANLVIASKRIAQGDLSAEKVDDKNFDREIFALSESMNIMRNSLRETIGSVINSANLLQTSSEELSNASSRLSEGANRQAAALEEISSSLEEMTANIHQNTDNSINTDNLMQEADKAIEGIVESANDSMNKSKEIASSLVDINDLVSQTNILALNASVEAARAGELGKGFGVIAKEVGRLADQTRNTAAGINGTATVSISSSENIATQLDAVLPSINKITSLVREITAASKEQGIGADQINNAITDLNNVTQETAANSEEVAASAENLSATADQMMDAIKKFRV